MIRSLAAILIFICAGTLAFGAENIHLNATYLFQKCEAMATVNERNMGSTSLSMEYCHGYVSAAKIALSRIHQSYAATMKNYGNWSDEKFVKVWLASVFTLGPDICFPENVNPKILAMVVAKYGREHPDALTGSEFGFVGLAFMEAFSCKEK